MPEFELICCVVNHEKGSKALQIAQKHGVKCGTIFLGKGTIKNKLLDMLDLNDSRKEIVFMVTGKETAYDTMANVSKEMAFHKHDHGIAFTMPVTSIIDAKKYEQKNASDNEKEEPIMYHSIFTIVDKGLAEEVIDAANDAGAKGGTIINARGSGADGMDMLFAMPVEPEREIIMILSESGMTDAITSAIRKRLNIGEPGNGILFVMEISKTYGLY